MPTPPTHSATRAIRRFYGLEERVYQVTVHEPTPPKRPVPEAFVQDLWRTQSFDTRSLATAEGEKLRILDPGRLNGDTGPDFLDAHVRIGAISWRGDVEVHIVSGDWFKHEHHEDERYDRVVLHVALYPDVWTGGLLRADGSVLPECILAPFLQAPLRDLLYSYHMRSAQDLLCAPRWADVPENVKRSTIDEHARTRFLEKRDRLGERFLSSPDLASLLHEEIFAALGYSKNAEPMRALAERIPRSLALDIQDPFDLEALHFGVGGLLPEPEDLLDAGRETTDYVMALRDRFEALQARLQLPVMARTRWQFFRLRPPNFPTLRIAQAVRLVAAGGFLHHNPIDALVKAVRAEKPRHRLEQLLRTPEPGPFWKTHLRPEKATKPRNPGIGRRRAHAMIINAVVPVLLLHADQVGDPALTSDLWNLVRAISAENNEVVRRFKELGARPSSAFESQGLYHLYRTGCEAARCLSCPIGKHVLNRS